MGGLSVASQIMRLLPNERILYFADNAHVPYGERPLEEIQSFALGITGFLIEQGAKAVVMACNMSSAVALDIAREHYPHTPILGMIEPGARAAMSVADGRPIGVLATTGTVKSGAYAREIAKLGCPHDTVQQACPRFVPLIESGRADSEEAEAAAADYVKILIDGKCSTIILGCTHYPFVRKAIEAAAGSCVTIVDPAEETARFLENILLEKGLASKSLNASHVFYTSGETDDFSALGSAFLGRPIENVVKVTWGVELGVSLKDAAV